MVNFKSKAWYTCTPSLLNIQFYLTCLRISLITHCKNTTFFQFYYFFFAKRGHYIVAYRDSCIRFNYTQQTWSIWLEAADKLSIHFWTNSSSFSKAPLPTESKWAHSSAIFCIKTCIYEFILKGGTSSRPELQVLTTEEGNWLILKARMKIKTRAWSVEHREEQLFY